MKESILITQPEYEKGGRLFTKNPGLHLLSAPEDEASLARAIRDHRLPCVNRGTPAPLWAMVGGVETRDRETRCPHRSLRRGHDGIDMQLTQRHGIMVANTPAVLDSSIAEHTIFLMGCLARHIAPSHWAMQENEWQPRCGSELRRQTLVVLGLGGIGRRVAAMAHVGFGMRVVAVGHSTAKAMEERNGRSLKTLYREFGPGSQECAYG